MKQWRWPTWLIVGWTVFIAVVMVLVIYPSTPTSDPYYYYSEPSTSYQAGTAFGEAFLYWFLGMLVFGPIWYFTRPRVRCPVCGNKVDPKAAMCFRCGYVPGGPLVPGFRVTFNPQPGWPPQPQPGWPPAPQPMWPTPFQAAWPPPPQSSNPFQGPSWQAPPQPGWPPVPQPGWPPVPQPGWPPAPSNWPPPPPPAVPNQLSDVPPPPEE